MRKAFVLWLILSFPICGQTPVKAPQRVEVEIGWPGTVEIENKDKLPLLVVNPFESKLQFRREYTDDPGVMRYFAFGREPGEFTLFMVGSKNDRPVIVGQITVVVSGTKPAPDVPVDDPLLTKLKAVYTSNTENAERVKRLQAIYKVAASTTCFDKSITALVELYNVVAKASGAQIPLPILEPERNIIAAELRSKLPTKDQPLTDELRKQVANEFSRVAVVLGELAK
jgi:hypothetical protein